MSKILTSNIIKNVSFLSILVFLISFLSLNINIIAQEITPFEQDNNTTATYKQIIGHYTKLAAANPIIELKEFGFSDIGKPLHAVIISKDQNFEPASIRSNGKLVLFINNGIHAGEPCGIDASMMLARDLAKENSSLLDSTVIVIIPAYNLGGVLNRNSHTRANQNGPISYGFRGNAKNLDLNRDFIKCDSRNAESFSQLFTRWSPDVFLDNHTTNGADYPYVMTLISTQKDKASPPISSYMNSQMIPALFDYMNTTTPYLMSTYVNVRSTPDEGIAGFLDLPRYSSGYAALHNTISFISEAHMLKPFDQRVRGTYELMLGILKTMKDQTASIKLARNIATNSFLRQDSFAVNWQLDFSHKDSILFKGYRSKKKESQITGVDRSYFDHDDAYEEYVPYYDHYIPTAVVKKPKYYIIPQGYHKVIERLQWNGIRVQRIDRDTLIEADYYYITDFDSRKTPYESHYLHSNVKVENKKMSRQYYRGDILVEVDQPGIRYIIETLEPQGADSFFAWNFFDGILMQKEHFSNYIFEDTAAELLKSDPELKKAFEEAKEKDESLRDNPRAQLDYIYRKSLHYEYTHRLYPVARVF